MTRFRRGDIVASTDGSPRKTRGKVREAMDLTEDDWADRTHCWMFSLNCRYGSQPCLRSRPDGPGDWVVVYWNGSTGPYAERAENLVKISP